jgi:hypothetical protein
MRHLRVRENVDIFPTGDVEPSSMGKKIKAGARQFGPPFAKEHGVQSGFQGVKI